MTLKSIVKMVQKWRFGTSKKGFPIRRNDSSATYKGHFVVYATDNSRFVMPLHYLNNNVFLELLRISEDKFGLPKNGPITLPCDSKLMNYLVDLFERGFSDDLEKALLASVVSDQSSCVC